MVCDCLQIEQTGFQVWVSDIVLHSWASYFTLTVPLSTQLYKWVLTNNPGMDKYAISGRVEILVGAN